MDTAKILVIGNHPEIMQIILRLINNKPEWNGTGAFTCDEAIAMLTEQPFQMVLMGAGIREEENNRLCKFVSTNMPNIPVVQHYGGGSGLLFAEIYEALAPK
ncbi:hypothetical protein BDD43_3196 [Mucilaginibacter gracilis]|uniref:Response regulator receiver domain-containing protein n=1 Tax=Mucilaginibacter gracilis TaxID=423350 RepID=A0A495J1Z3_9SPHI|nr:hypothetical protein [Mucilaginibacter gracilis]RKR82996.1 hypothetical protein BDD43_3196 [Mucilaginibacter gracilis]